MSNASKCFITIGCGEKMNDAFDFLKMALKDTTLTCDDFVLTSRHYYDWAFFYIKTNAKDDMFHAQEGRIVSNLHDLYNQGLLTYTHCGG